MKGLYSGRFVVGLRDSRQKITRTQTAEQAYNAIIKTYGLVEPNGHYFHVGKGNWRKHDLARDKMRTGKYAATKTEWAEQPHKLDWPGVDDRQFSKNKSTVKKSRIGRKIKAENVNTRFSLSTLKVPTNLKSRKSKSLPVKSKKLVLKTFQPKIKKEYNFQAIKAPALMKKRKSKLIEMPKNFVVKHTGYFGKDLTQGKFRPAVNLKKSVVKILQKEYPSTQFAVTLSDINQGSFSSIGVYWTGRPSKREIEVLSINMGGQGRKDYKMNKHNINYYHVDPKEMEHRIQQMTKDADSRRFWQVTLTQPLTSRKPKMNLKKALGKLKAPEKPLSRKTKVKPDKGISFVFNGIPSMPQKVTLKNNVIKVTGYKEAKPLFSYNIKLSDVDKAAEYADPYFLQDLIKRSIPESIRKEYPGKSIDYAQEQAIEKVYRDYQRILAEKKPHGITKKEPGTFEYYGKKLKEGKFKDDFANMKTNIIDALKSKYPDTLFLIVVKGFYNTEADVYWAGVPSETQVKKLGLGVHADWWGKIGHDIFWHHVSEDKMRSLVYKVEHNKALKTKLKAGYTRKVVQSDWEKPKPVVKMPAKIPKETPAAVPKKQLKSRNVKTPIQKHTPVYKTGAPKKKLYKGFLVTGNTYPVKNLIDNMGGKWNKAENGWIVPANAAAAKKINALRKEKGLKVSAIKTEENVFRHLTEAERLDIRKEKAERKIDRWENKASKMNREAAVREKAATDVLDNIPFGQPILVGHYSEQADRNRRNKAFNNLGKAYDARKEASEATRKASTLSHVMNRLESTEGLKGRVLKLEKEYNHAKNKVTQAERDLEYAKQRKSLEDIERLKKEIRYWENTAANLQADIVSIKERIPTSAMNTQISGVSMTVLGGTKLKPLVGATSVAKRYHNKNLSGGNFAIEVRKGSVAVELQGYHDTDGIITSLRIGTLFGIGTPVITKENYKTFEVSRLVELIKRALSAVKN